MPQLFQPTIVIRDLVNWKHYQLYTPPTQRSAWKWPYNWAETYRWNYSLIQYGLVLRQFVLWRFTFTTLVQSDRALPTCGASLSQLKRPFCT